jgi:hypothetical protein
VRHWCTAPLILQCSCSLCGRVACRAVLSWMAYTTWMETAISLLYNARRASLALLF